MLLNASIFVKYLACIDPKEARYCIHYMYATIKDSDKQLLGTMGHPLSKGFGQ